MRKKEVKNGKSTEDVADTDIAIEEDDIDVETAPKKASNADDFQISSDAGFA